MIVYSSKLVPTGFIGMTIYPFIFLSLSKKEIVSKYGDYYHKKLINHEGIHIKQQAELLIIPFYILYILNWVINLFVTKDAYKNISFEREANINEDNMNYLKERRHYSWIKYISRRK